MVKNAEKPQFDEWDFTALSEEYGVDIYIIDKHNVVSHSNKTDEVGLDFAKCCQTFSELLHTCRESGGFFVDAMDVEQSSGEVRRYSYMATDDQEYIIELGYSLEDGAVFEQFSFLKAIDELIERTTMIKNINVLNIEGHSLGSVDQHLPEGRRSAFRKTRATKETTEVTEKYSTINYRYVYYETPFKEAIAQSIRNYL